MPQLLYSPLASTGQQRGFYGPRPPDIRKLPPPPLPPPSLPPPPSHLAGRRLVRVSSSDRLVSGRSATATTWPSHHEAASHDSSRTGGNEIDKQSPYDQSHQIPTFKPNYDIPLLDPSTVPPPPFEPPSDSRSLPFQIETRKALSGPYSASQSSFHPAETSKNDNRSDGWAHIRKTISTTHLNPVSESEFSATITSQPRALSAISHSIPSSEADRLAHYNQRQFPPLLPAAAVYRSSTPRDRSRAANHIAAWVSRYEQSNDNSEAGLKESSGDNIVKRPLRRQDGEFNGDISNDGEVDDSGFAARRIEDLWQQMKAKRQKAHEIKSVMAQKRRALRILRRSKDDADNAFMGMIRPILVHQPGQLPCALDHRKLVEKMTEMQNLRTDYHLLESEYEGLEEILDEEDGILSSLEVLFFGTLAAHHNEHYGQTSSVTSDEKTGVAPPLESDNVPLELRGISPNGPSEEIHPLYADLTSALGDLQLAQEEFGDLLHLKDQTDEEMRVRTLTGQDETPEDIMEFLDEFSTEAPRRETVLVSCETEVQRLKMECEQQNVMRKHISVQMEFLLNPDDPVPEEALDLQEEDEGENAKRNLAHHKFSDLLSQPDHLLSAPDPIGHVAALRAATKLSQDDVTRQDKVRTAAKEYNIMTLLQDFEPSAKWDFVNRWLLLNLRINPLNTVLLCSLFESGQSLTIVDLRRWQSDVLFWWWRDEAVDLFKKGLNFMTAADSCAASNLSTATPSRARSAGDLVYRSHAATRFPSDAITLP